MFDDLGAKTSIEIIADKPHTTSYDDPQKYFEWIWAGLGIASDYVTYKFSDIDYIKEGYYLRFDQRAYTTKEDFWRANLDINGYLYIPKRCADGTVASCKLHILFYGCGSKYASWAEVLEEGSESAGWGANGNLR